MFKLFIKQIIEGKTTNHPVKPAEIIDARWYDRFEKLGSFQAYKFFEGNKKFRDQQRKSFLNMDTRNPVFDYPLINQVEIQIHSQEVIKLNRDISNKEKNPIVLHTYLPKIEEKLAELNLMKLAYKLSQEQKSVNSEKLGKEFQIISEKLYGKPTEKLFAYSVAKTRAKIRLFIGKNAPTDAAAMDLLAVLPEIEEETFFSALEKNQLEKYLARYFLIDDALEMINLSEIGGMLGASEIKKYFEKLLLSMGITDWKVKLAKNLMSISIDHQNKQIIIPRWRKMNRDKLRMLMVHEIGVHVRRRSNGENSPLKLLGLGLQGYETGEEGLAGICEDILKESYDITFGSLVGYLSVGMVYGLDGVKRDFRDLFDILHKFYRFKIVKNCENTEKMDLNKVDRKAKKLAWFRACRIFRGSGGAIKGVCFTKDIIYLKGRMCVWDQIRNESKELSRLFCGKYDPCNPEHVRILDELGM